MAGRPLYPLRCALGRILVPRLELHPPGVVDPPPHEDLPGPIGVDAPHLLDLPGRRRPAKPRAAQQMETPFTREDFPTLSQTGLAKLSLRIPERLNPLNFPTHFLSRARCGQLGGTRKPSVSLLVVFPVKAFLEFPGIPQLLRMLENPARRASRYSLLVPPRRIQPSRPTQGKKPGIRSGRATAGAAHSM